jgi:hypothetical protein
MDGLRVAEKSVELLCDTSLQAPTTSYARALNQAVWQDRDDLPIGEQLEPFKSAFLFAARLSLGTTTPAADSPGRPEVAREVVDMP